MLHIHNVHMVDGTYGSVTIPSPSNHTIDGKNNLLLLPALIDPHVHFRTPGNEYKEDWSTAATASIAGGVTTVFDMPNNSPPAVDSSSLSYKISLIDEQLVQAGIPLRYHLWLGADKDHLHAIEKLKGNVIGIKIYMGSTTGGLLMDDPASMEEVFKIAGRLGMVVAVHAEDEEFMQEQKKKFHGVTDPSIHSKIRDRKAAVLALSQAISFSEKYRTKLYVVHVSTRDELNLIRQAKKKGIPVFAEVTPHHLYLTEEHYSTLGTFAQMNPPVRTQDDIDALWNAIEEGVIDTIGSDHAPHTREEKLRPYGEAPSGVPGVEMILPLLMTAYYKGKISLEKIVALTSTNAAKMFQIPPTNDWVLVDEAKIKPIEENDVKSKCGWTPYTGIVCRGWPHTTILKGIPYEISTLSTVVRY